MLCLRSTLMLAVLLGVGLACAGTQNPPLSSLQSRMEEARVNAAALDAALWCPEQWTQAEYMVLRAEQFKKIGQTESARAALQFAASLYDTAAQCAAAARDRERMPAPIPPAVPAPGTPR